MRVLIVDDSTEFLILAQAVIERGGHYVECAMSAPTHAGDFDLVLADQNLIEKKGIDFLEEVRAGDDGAQLVLISATRASKEVEARLKAIEATFVQKPLSPRKLMSLLGESD